ncbi:MAG TPA: acyl-CoA dehydrogenase family protein [Acidimicrobiales bacterium]|nr:acyl-CoA dehydrogenase family protein [Acidimicrobiales bacterium]
MGEATESLDSFRDRARAWIDGNLPRAGDPAPIDDRTIQNALFDAGFAGIAFPRRYGGAGLTFEHQKVFFALTAGYRTPTGYGVSIGMLGATLLDHGSDESKQEHLPRILRGDELWIQLLSEPSGGSDMAGALTRLTRDGDTYVLNGSKMWSSGALRSDYGMCLARTDWDAPKHRGLSMIAVPLKGTPGLTIDAIRQVTGAPAEFCLEFFDDVVLPAGNLIGRENEGWAVAQTLLFHERNATAGIAHGYGLMVEGSAGRDDFEYQARGARHRGLGADPVLRQAIATSYVEQTVARCAGSRVMTGMRTGALQGQWGSLLKLHLGSNSPQSAKRALAAWGPDGVIWDGNDAIAGNAGELFLGSRGISIAGGSNEMQRNIVTERLMGLPREPAFDRDLPFNEVQRNRGRFQAAPERRD